MDESSGEVLFREEQRFGNLPTYLVAIGAMLLLSAARLVVEVRSDGLYYRFSPFHRSWHRIPLARIKTAEARTYRPLLEYGGWGIRYGLGGKAYNVGGNRGVQLKLENGKRILFGSHEADALAAAIKGAKEAK
jgi:hypothetical protein